MKTRSQELREKHRRVLAWGFIVAGLVHVGVLFALPSPQDDASAFSDGNRTPGGGGEAASDPGLEAVGGEADVAIYVRVLFGPPDIFDQDGNLVRKPEDRELGTARMVRLPSGCGDLGPLLPAEGRVQIRAWGSGHTDIIDLIEGTGSECGDQIITAVSDALWYRWLPNERFPAPVDLIQPVRLIEAGNERS